MAKTKSKTTEVNRATTVAEINEAAQFFFRARFDTEKEIRRLTELHIKPLKDDVKAMKQDAKGRTGIQLADLNLGYKVYERDKLTQEFDDPDEANDVRTHLSLIFQGLGRGGSLDLFDDVLPATEGKVVDIAGAKEAKKAKADPTGFAFKDLVAADDVKPARVEGHEDFNEGFSPNDNPYDTGTRNHFAWVIGWHAQQGGAAFRDGASKGSNKHKRGSLEWDAWRYGWESESAVASAQGKTSEATAEVAAGA